MTTKPPSSNPPPGKPASGSPYEELRRAQQAIRAAQRGEVVALPELGKGGAAAKTAGKGARAPKAFEPLNATAREAAEHRAIALLRTMTDYYGINEGELNDERDRLRTLSDERLIGVVKAYEFASKHALVMLHENKAREAAISQSAQTATFFSKHGVSEEDIQAQRAESARSERAGHRAGRPR